MRKSFVMLGALAGVAALAVSGAQAKDVGVNAKANTSVSTQGTTLNNKTSTDANLSTGTTNTGTNTTTSTNRPYGWDQGKKTGWDCKEGQTDCMPPGLAKKQPTTSTGTSTGTSTSTSTGTGD